MDFALRLEPRRLPRGGNAPPACSGKLVAKRSRRARAECPRDSRQDHAATNWLLRGHRAPGRARLRKIRRRGMDWKEYLHPESEAGVVVVPRRHSDFA